MNTVIPIMWGINEVMSVISSVLSLGFTGALIIEYIFYILVSCFNTI